MTRVSLTITGILCLAAAATVYGADLYVDPSGTCGGNAPCYTTISAAINAALPDDVVHVLPGTYDETNILVDKSVLITGDPSGPCPGPGPSAPVIQGTNTGNERGFIVQAGVDNVTIEGFVIQNLGGSPNTGGGACGIWAYGNSTDPTTNITIRNNHFRDIRWAHVFFFNDGQSAFDHIDVNCNLVELGTWSSNTNVYGIECTNCVNSTVKDNTITGGYDGILITSQTTTGAAAATVGTGVVVEGNTISGTAEANILMSAFAQTTGAPAPTLQGVTIRGNTLSNDHRLLLAYPSSFGAGYPTATVKSITVQDNDFTLTNPTADGYAMYLNAGGVSAFTGNTVTLGGTLSSGTFVHGLDLSGGGNDTGPIAWNITGNTFTGNNVGTASAAIRIRDALPATTTINILANQITGWANGLYANNLNAAMDVNAHLNWLYGNSNAGVSNGGAGVAVIDATNNWWGDASGPYDPAGSSEVLPCSGDWTTDLNADGAGNGVTDYVVYCPFAASPPGVELIADEACYKPGDTMTVSIRMVGMTDTIVGGQFYLAYDNASLTLVSADPGDAPFTREIVELAPAAGKLFYAVGVPDGGPGTSSDTVMARLTFTIGAAVSGCNLAELVGFEPDAGGLQTKLSNSVGQPVVMPQIPLPTITVDSTPPVITCPGDVTVGCGQLSDPPATGVATATDNCDPAPAITYDDDRSGLTGCNATGTIIRTWTATDCSGNTTTCTQNITLVDMTPPVIAGCPTDITVNAEAGGCAATVTYTAPTATDECYFEGFEDPQFVSGAPYIGSGGAPSVNWNDYNSHLARVASGTDGITSKSGGFHGVIDSTSLPPAPDDYSGVFSRLRGYTNVFGTGFQASVDVYLDVDDPAVVADTYGWDVSCAASRQDGSHLRDFIFHTAGKLGAGYNRILVAGSNNTNFTRRNDLASINHYEVTASGWYTFEWVFRDNGSDQLAVDMNLRDAGGTLLWTETRSTPTDVISTVVGGNRYMWFTFLQVDQLAIDNTRLIRNVPVTCAPPSGSSFTGTTTVTCTAADACGNTETCAFDVTVEPYNELVVSVELSPTVAAGPITRCITFELFDCPTSAPTVVNEVLTFTNGLASNVVVLVPCGSYNCITARDKLHSLRRTDETFAIVGTQYVADFTGNPAMGGDWLIGGNLNDDYYIDILDFGIYAWQYSQNYGSGNTTCSTASPHADVTGDGLVTVADFTFIQINFLKAHEANCCGLATMEEFDDTRTDGGGARTSIAVSELRSRGMGNLAVADLNGDGTLDANDIAAWMTGKRPTPVTPVRPVPPRLRK